MFRLGSIAWVAAIYAIALPAFAHHPSTMAITPSPAQSWSQAPAGTFALSLDVAVSHLRAQPRTYENPLGQPSHHRTSLTTVATAPLSWRMSLVAGAEIIGANGNLRAERTWLGTNISLLDTQNFTVRALVQLYVSVPNLGLEPAAGMSIGFGQNAWSFDAQLLTRLQQGFSTHVMGFAQVGYLLGEVQVSSGFTTESTLGQQATEQEIDAWAGLTWLPDETLQVSVRFGVPLQSQSQRTWTAGLFLRRALTLLE